MCLIYSFSLFLFLSLAFAEDILLVNNRMIEYHEFESFKNEVHRQIQELKAEETILREELKKS